MKSYAYIVLLELQCWLKISNADWHFGCKEHIPSFLKCDQFRIYNSILGLEGFSLLSLFSLFYEINVRSFKIWDPPMVSNYSTRAVSFQYRSLHSWNAHTCMQYCIYAVLTKLCNCFRILEDLRFKLIGFSRATASSWALSLHDCLSSSERSLHNLPDSTFLSLQAGNALASAVWTE